MGGPGDWEHTAWGRGHAARLPHSCCSATTTAVCSREESEAAVVHTTGCHAALLGLGRQYAWHALSLLLGLLLLQAGAAALAWCLGRSQDSYSPLS